MTRKDSIMSWISTRPHFRENSYSIKQTRRVLNPVARSSKPKDKPTSVALLPFAQTTYGRLSRMWPNTSKVLSSFLRPMKDDMGLRTLGVHSIPCGCGKVYIGQTGRSMESKVKEHHRHIWLGHPNKSVVAERSFKHDCLIKF
jgi:hypothetical protein